jgi:hypothetical protein
MSKPINQCIEYSRTKIFECLLHQSIVTGHGNLSRYESWTCLLARTLEVIKTNTHDSLDIETGLDLT